MELQADRLAVEAMANAGWDPTALLAYIRRVQPQDGGLSILPRGQRISALEQAISKLPATSYAPAVDLAPIQAEVRRALPPAPVGRATLPL